MRTQGHGLVLPTLLVQMLYARTFPELRLPTPTDFLQPHMPTDIRDAPVPGAAVELAAHHVAAVSLETRGGTAVVAAHAAEALPEGALVPSLNAQNLNNRAAVAAALHRVLEQIGRPRRIGLVIPDPVAKVSIVRFDRVPPRAQDLDQLIRWQVRKAAPFPVEDAQVSYVGGLAADGQEFVVTLARRSGALAAIQPISPVEALDAIIHSAYARRWRMTGEALCNLADTLERAVCVRLEYSDLEPAVQALGEIAGVQAEAA